MPELMIKGKKKKFNYNKAGMKAYSKALAKSKKY
tara:strand:+ start:4754 stop:4855 length:102 start_codon:yes stop_codon:yes gene_type:complete